MGRFATREDEVDDLFRLGVFTDLYRVVRQGVRAGVENYSIKRLEPLCGYDRRVDLDEATASLIALEAALEDGTAAGDGERQRVVAGYNQDDCRARRIPRPNRFSSSSPTAARSASPGPRTRSSATSSTPCTSTPGGATPRHPGSASGRNATTRTGMWTPRR